MNKIFSRFLLSVILSIIFLALSFPFLIEGGGGTIEEFMAIGGVNMWRTVLVFGFLTLITIFVTFWKKAFRLTAVLLLGYWLLGTGIVFALTFEDLKRGNFVTKSSGQVGETSCNEQETLTKAKLATYPILREDGGYGSGFGIKPEGFIVTNWHVVKNARGLTTTITTEPIPVRVWSYSAKDDLAVLKVEAQISTIPWADSSKIQLAETLFAIGWPNEPVGESSVTRGVYSRTNRYENSLEFIQTDAAVNPGSSGGPLVNKCGVVGVNALKEFWSQELLPRPLEGIGNAISSNYANPIIEGLMLNKSSL